MTAAQSGCSLRSRFDEQMRDVQLSLITHGKQTRDQWRSGLAQSMSMRRRVQVEQLFEEASSALRKVEAHGLRHGKLVSAAQAR